MTEPTKRRADEPRGDEPGRTPGPPTGPLPEPPAARAKRRDVKSLPPVGSMLPELPFGAFPPWPLSMKPAEPSDARPARAEPDAKPRRGGAARRSSCARSQDARHSRSRRSATDGR